MVGEKRGVCTRLVDGAWYMVYMDNGGKYAVDDASGKLKEDPSGAVCFLILAFVNNGIKTGSASGILAFSQSSISS